MKPRMLAWQNSAPPSGWGVTYSTPELEGKKIRSDGSSPAEVLSKIKAWRVNNGLDPNEDEVADWLNEVWCSRAPERCPGWQKEAPPVITAGGRRILRPVDYGPWVWQFLNTFGVVFDKDRFLFAVEQAASMLDPRKSDAGCALCRDHFIDARKAYLPENVDSKISAGVWAWSVHNLANTHAGKRQFSYFEVARKYGWEPLKPDELATVQAHLRTKP